VRRSLERHVGEPKQGENVIDWLVRANVEAHVLAGAGAAEAMRVAAEWWDAMHEAGPPRRDIYEQFMNGIFVPAYNAYYRPYKKQLCVECWALMGLEDGRSDGASYHDDKCAARARQRGREKVNGGKSNEEVALKRRDERVKRHWKSHADCPAMRGEICLTLEMLIKGTMPIEKSKRRMRQYHENSP
jgi:hypothetical protein